MVDLHTHILPQIDDGAGSCEEAVRLIKIEIASGVDTIALTPHYYIERDSSASFARKRDAAYAKLNDALQTAGVSVNLVKGAEVFLCPDALKYGNRNTLCYAHTGYMLVELPDTYFPEWAPEVLAAMLNSGVTPVLAHVERYDALINKPDMLFEIVRSGVLVQTNAGSLINESYKIRSALFRLIEHNLIHLIVSDTHSIDHRPPFLKTAMETIVDRYGSEKADYFVRNSRNIICNKKPVLYEPQQIK